MSKMTYKVMQKRSALATCDNTENNKKMKSRIKTPNKHHPNANK